MSRPDGWLTRPRSVPGWTACARRTSCRFSPAAGDQVPRKLSDCGTALGDLDAACGWLSVLSVPRVEERNAGLLKIPRIARDKRQPVMQRGCGDDEIGL